ncbi:hypothetical protein L1D50_21615, partial [Pseudoalteromonas sp. Isolate6]|nr:hypothetical protein [Pseudoalteromonas sp. Isolate6]
TENPLITNFERNDKGLLRSAYCAHYLHSLRLNFQAPATFVMAVVASLYPAWQATKTDPAKVLGNG